MGVVTTTYDPSGQPATLAGTSAYVSGASYTALHQPLQITYGSGLVANFDYYDTPSETDYSGSAQPQDYRLKRLTYQTAGGTVRQQLDYRYDRAGNLARWWRTDESAVLHDWTFTTDDLDRVTGASVTNPPSGQPSSFSYTYDALGRITSGPLGTYGYGYATHTHAASTAGSNSYAYDANGSLTGRTEAAGAFVHSYDLEGRQTQISVNGGADYGFVYNGDGALVARLTNGTTTVHYLAGGLYEKTLSGGAVLKSYRFAGRLVAVRDSALHYLGQDHLGSTTLQTSTAGAVEGAQLRGPYGQPWYATGTLATDFKYTDQRSLEATVGSLYDYGARSYSPVLGRFLSADPLVAPGSFKGLDSYSYARANPMRLVDPSGMADVDAAGAEDGSCDAACVAEVVQAVSGSSFADDSSAGSGGGFQLGAVPAADFATAATASVQDLGRANVAALGQAIAQLMPHSVGATAGFSAEGGLLDKRSAGFTANAAVLVATLDNGSVRRGDGNILISGGVFETKEGRTEGSPSGHAAALGGFAGVGSGLIVTNATKSQQLSGPFETVKIDLGFIGIAGLDVSWSNGPGGLIWTASPTLGGGGGVGFAWMKTETWIKR